uniref:Ribosomal protein L16 n=1 Tax=Eukaryota sp. BB2 TaxID=1949062 RepID=A0A1X8VEW8_9EUKA|nr:ribosomal protein L16 [Eukaryota sp. BB2]AQL10438.1 ribosomal protein L16 [Eukaryota sp. BB2]
MAISNKIHKSRIYKEGISHKQDYVHRGKYGIFCLQNGVVTIRQLETTRVALRRVLGKSCPIWIRIQPQKPVTKKSTGVRMGKGKGSFSHYIYYVKKDEMIFEIGDISASRVVKAYKLAASKLPVRTNIIQV